MDRPNPRRRRTYSRRDFLKGVGGGAIGVGVGTTIMNARPLGSRPEEELEARASKSLSLTVNGRSVTVEVKPRETLLSVLREKLGLTGSKRVCDRGECGACTVILNGRPVYACMTLAARLDGQSVTTVEGLARNGKLHPVQQAFIDKDAYQCGFCTPGFLTASAALLAWNASPSPEDIKAGLSGNLCRCGSYQKIYEAVAAAAKSKKP
jgi:aerobic-type carbon monoxide dehydrogenase small subunit (CoxS/CutS family)